MSWGPDSARSRLMWGLVALTALYAIATVVVFVVSGSFGLIWFVASLVVYGLLFAVAVLFSATDPGRLEAIVPGAAATESDDEPIEPEHTTARVLGRETRYETRTGRVLEVHAAVGDDERSFLVAETRDSILPMHRIEARIDRAALDAPSPAPRDRVEAALRERASAEPPEAPTVAIDEQRTLYKAGAGRVVEATYRVDGQARQGLFVITPEGAAPIEDLETALDDLPPADDVDADAIDAAVRRHQAVRTVTPL